MSEAHSAFQKFQAALEPIVKTAEVKVQGNRGNYTFKYSTLDAIIEHIKPLMAEHGLWFSQSVKPADGGATYVTTTIYHDEEEIVGAAYPLPANLNPQQLGSWITYLKRYQLASLVGLATEDDDDANIAEGNTIQSKKSGKLSRSDLMKQMRALYEELKAVDDRTTFAQIMTGAHSLIEQISRDLEKEWYGPVEDGKPWLEAIEDLRDKLPEEESEDAF